MMDEILRDYFSQESEEFNNYTEKSHSITKEILNWERLYTDVLDKDVKKILNVGCGPGTEAILLARMGYEVTALDFSPEMIAYTQKNAEANGVTVNTVIGDAEDLPFEVCSFDAVVSNYAIWAIPHPQKAMEEWFRVLRIGGEVAYIDGSWSTKDYGVFRRSWMKIAMRLRKRDGNSHPRITSPEETERLSNLWSVNTIRPEEDLNMMRNAGFSKIDMIEKVDRRIFSGIRYLEYGYHKVHFMIRGWKTDTSDE